MTNLIIDSKKFSATWIFIKVSECGFTPNGGVYGERYQQSVSHGI